MASRGKGATDPLTPQEEKELAKERKQDYVGPGAHKYKLHTHRKELQQSSLTRQGVNCSSALRSSAIMMLITSLAYIIIQARNFPPNSTVLGKCVSQHSTSGICLRRKLLYGRRQ